MTWRERAEKIRNRPSGVLTKPTKGSFVSSVSDPTDPNTNFLTREAAGLLADAARKEGVEFDSLLAHLDPEDWLAYAERDLPDLRQPEVAAAVVRGIVAAAESGRCTCDRCREGRA